MKERILRKAADLFLNLGVRKVTMDKIAQELGMSKKTVYTYFGTKTRLIEATSLYVFENISEGIERIRGEKKDPIEELFSIKNFVLLNLKNEKSSPQYQLEKYYPKIYDMLRIKQKKLIENIVLNNLEKGMAQDIYRKDLKASFISRMYFIGMMGIKDRRLFPEEMFRSSDLTEYFLEYHLRSIVTEKGLKTLENIILLNK